MQSARWSHDSMDKSKHSIGDLLERRHDDEALAELALKKGDASRLAAGFGD